MKNEQLKELERQLPSCGTLKGVKISYAIARNIGKIAKEVEYFTKEVEKLQLAHTKMKDGKPVMKGNEFQMKDLTKFSEEYEHLLNIEIKLDLHKIKLADVPQDITTQQMTAILPFVTET